MTILNKKTLSDDKENDLSFQAKSIFFILIH